MTVAVTLEQPTVAFVKSYHVAVSNAVELDAVRRDTVTVVLVGKVASSFHDRELNALIALPESYLEEVSDWVVVEYVI